MAILLGDVYVWFRIPPREKKCNFGMVYAWGIQIDSGFTITGWDFLIPLDLKGLCLCVLPNNPPPGEFG